MSRGGMDVGDANCGCPTLQISIQMLKLGMSDFLPAQRGEDASVAQGRSRHQVIASLSHRVTKVSKLGLGWEFVPGVEMLVLLRMAGALEGVGHTKEGKGPFMLSSSGKLVATAGGFSPAQTQYYRMADAVGVENLGLVRT